MFGVVAELSLGVVVEPDARGGGVVVGVVAEPWSLGRLQNKCRSACVAGREGEFRDGEDGEDRRQ